MPPVTLREIADRVGCTRSTVSYALRDHPSISAAMRRRVQEVAAQLGWQPNGILRRQMALVRSTMMRDDLPLLGAVVGHAPDELERLPTIRGHLKGVISQAGDLGFGLEVFNVVTDPMEPDRLAAHLVERGVRGLVLVDLGPQVPRGYWDLAGRFAAVALGVDLGQLPISVAISDYHSMGRRSIQELRRAGFRRPGLAMPRGTESLLQGRLTAGYHSGVASLPAADRLPVFFGSGDTLYIHPSEYVNVVAWIEQHRPDVLLGIDTLGLAKCLALLPSEARVPVYSLDWHPGEGAVGGIDQRPEALGRAALNTLVAQLGRGETGPPALPLSVLVREEWVPASTGLAGDAGVAAEPSPRPLGAC